MLTRVLIAVFLFGLILLGGWALGGVRSDRPRTADGQPGVREVRDLTAGSRNRVPVGRGEVEGPVLGPPGRSTQVGVEGESTDVGDLPFSVQCRVVASPLDTPQPGVRIGLVDSRGLEVDHADSDALGRATLRCAREGTYEVRPLDLPPQWAKLLRARYPYSKRSPSAVTPQIQLDARTPDLEVTLRLTRAATVSGTLIAGGTPVSETFVRLDLVYDHNTIDTLTDAAGRFRFERVPAGTYELRCRLGDSDLKASHVSPRDREIRVEEGDLLDLGEVVCPTRPTGSIVGVVVDTDGVPFEGASVRCYPADSDLGELLSHVFTDADGRFELTAIPAEMVKVSVWDDRHEGAPRMFREPLQPRTVQGTNGRIDLDRLVFERTNPARLRVTVRFDADDRRASRHRFNVIVARGAWHTDELSRVAAGPERLLLRGSKPAEIRPGEHVLEWESDADTKTWTVFVLPLFRRSTPQSRQVVPVRGRTADLEFRF